MFLQPHDYRRVASLLYVFEEYVRTLDGQSDFLSARLKEEFQEFLAHLQSSFLPAASQDPAEAELSFH